jgi:hypothetical protein
MNMIWTEADPANLIAGIILGIGLAHVLYRFDIWPFRSTPSTTKSFHTNNKSSTSSSASSSMLAKPTVVHYHRVGSSYLHLSIIADGCCYSLVVVVVVSHLN